MAELNVHAIDNILMSDFNYDKDEAMGDGGNTTVIPTKNVINVRKVTI